MVKDTAGRVDAPPLSSRKDALTTAARPRFASAPLTRPHGSWSKRVTRSRLPAVSSAVVVTAVVCHRGFVIKRRFHNHHHHHHQRRGSKTMASTVGKGQDDKGRERAEVRVIPTAIAKTGLHKNGLTHPGCPPRWNNNILVLTCLGFFGVIVRARDKDRYIDCIDTCVSPPKTNGRHKTSISFVRVRKGMEIHLLADLVRQLGVPRKLMGVALDLRGFSLILFLATGACMRACDRVIGRKKHAG